MPATMKEKLYFGVCVDRNKKFHHLFIYKKSKNILTDELRDKGFVPKGVFYKKILKK